MKKNILLLTAIAMGAIIITLLAVQWYRSPRIAYVDLPRVFSGFELKKELESKLLSEQRTKNKIIDSLKISLGRTELSNEKAFQTVGYERQQVMQTAAAFEADQQQKTKEFNDQIFKRMNDYVRQYASEKGYDFILGAEGSGIIMAADSRKDVTEEVIAYINAKYQGK